MWCLSRFNKGDNERIGDKISNSPNHLPNNWFIKQQVPKSGYMNGILNAKYTYVSLSMEYTMNGLDYMNGARVKKELENGGICFGWETADDGRV